MNDPGKSGTTVDNIYRLVVQIDSLDRAFVDADTTIGAKTGIDNGLLVTLNSLSGTCVNASFTGCADFGINFSCHF